VTATIPITLPIKDIDQQVKLEIVAIHDGVDTDECGAPRNLE